MNRYLCVHGHFYQPPRENPWLEEVELQDSAHPYHDWNERVNAECYAPNTASRIYGPDRKIARMVNNFSSISFNFGPTLLSWMERHAPEDYRNILQADEESRKRFSGHGSALAQVYNHMIMPLANARDIRTQVYWGIRDFEHRFKRKPEGMWLAETAVNTATLEMLAEYGIKFTILAPHQAARVRKIGEEKWTTVKDASIDPQMVYVCPLPSGRRIHLFFYDGPISREVAFTDLLRDGVNFANRLLGVFPKDQHHPGMVHIATDGETYGHHHHFGDMALAYCLHHISTHHLARVTIYAEYMAKFPATHEIQIHENTSWSCSHGVERWRADCGCNVGGRQGWHQKWRAPLRQALDWLRDSLIPLYEEEMRAFTDDPWRIRDHYIEVILDRDNAHVEKFLEGECRRQLTSSEKVKILKLLELQRHAQLMYTSCGWFFDDISGIEAVQILQYAGRVLQLARELFGQEGEGHFLKMLEAAPSNIPAFHNGAVIYKKFVQGAGTDLTGVGAHYAVAALFDDYTSPAGFSRGEEKEIYGYTVRLRQYDLKEDGGRMLFIGRVHIRSRITWEEGDIDFAVLNSGDHDLRAGACPQMAGEVFEALRRDMGKAFAENNITAMEHLIVQHFGPGKYALKHLFRDEQRRTFDKVIRATMEEFEAHVREISERYYPLMQVREELHIPLPKALVNCIEFVLNKDLLDLLGQEETDVAALSRIAADVKRWSFEIDKTAVRFAAVRKITGLMRALEKTPQDTSLLRRIRDILHALAPLALDLDLWRAQKLCLLLSRDLPAARQDAGQEEWQRLFRELADDLNIHHS